MHNSGGGPRNLKRSKKRLDVPKKNELTEEEKKRRRRDTAEAFCHNDVVGGTEAIVELAP